YSGSRAASRACRCRATPRGIRVSPPGRTKCETIRSQRLGYVICGCRLPRSFLLCESSFQPRDVLQQTLAGQNEKVVTELRILEVDFEQPLIGYRQHLSVFDTLDCPRTSVVWREEAEFSHKTPGWKLDVDFLDQKLACDRQEHFGRCITPIEQFIAAAIFALGHERFEPFHRHVTLRCVASLLDELEHLPEANGVDRKR